MSADSPPRLTFVHYRTHRAEVRFVLRVGFGHHCLDDGGTGRATTALEQEIDHCCDKRRGLFLSQTLARLANRIWSS